MLWVLSWAQPLLNTSRYDIHYNEETVKIHDTIQHAIRGGLDSVLGDNYVKCKNKQTGPKYTGKENYLKYLDFNWLYVSAMVQALPTGEIKVSDNNSYTRSNSNKGYIGTIDINYNDELKQKAKKYPFFPEKTKGDINQFTDYQNENKKKGPKPNRKLRIKLTEKEDYIFNWEILDLYLENGLRLEDDSIKQKLENSKSEWLMPYIEFNIHKRKEAKAKGD